MLTNGGNLKSAVAKASLPTLDDSYTQSRGMRYCTEHFRIEMNPCRPIDLENASIASNNCDKKCCTEQSKSEKHLKCDNDHCKVKTNSDEKGCSATKVRKCCKRIDREDEVVTEGKDFLSAKVSGCSESNDCRDKVNICENSCSSTKVHECCESDNDHCKVKTNSDEKGCSATKVRKCCKRIDREDEVVTEGKDFLSAKVSGCSESNDCRDKVNICENSCSSTKVHECCESNDCKSK